LTQLKFAIIGSGRIAQRHAAHIAAKGKLVAVCDIIVERADLLAETYNTKAWYSIEDLLTGEKDIDVLVICTPNGLHAQHSIKALQAGFHVLCEKPMAIKTIDCEAMIQAAEKAGKRLFIVKQNRYNPPVAVVKKIVNEGRLGKINSLQLNCFWNRDEAYYKNSWKGTADLDGGTLFTQFSHFVDLLYWMVGDVEKVNAFTRNFAHQGIIEFEDTGVVILQFANGAIGSINYTVNSFAKNMEGSLSLFGEKGTVKIGGQYLNELEYQNIDDYTIEKLPPGNQPNNYGDYVGSMSNHDKVYDNVLDVLQNNAAPTASVFEGLKTVEIIEKIYKATTRL
jgi:UDP-N-acetyl-2-amino-2-deoxyglucuronate dehydrogenase